MSVAAHQASSSWAAASVTVPKSVSASAQGCTTALSHDQLSLYTTEARRTSQTGLLNGELVSENCGSIKLSSEDSCIFSLLVH